MKPGYWLVCKKYEIIIYHKANYCTSFDISHTLDTHLKPNVFSGFKMGHVLTLLVWIPIIVALEMATAHLVMFA